MARLSAQFGIARLRLLSEQFHLAKEEQIFSSFDAFGTSFYEEKKKWLKKILLESRRSILDPETSALASLQELMQPLGISIKFE